MSADDERGYDIVLNPMHFEEEKGVLESDMLMGLFTIIAIRALPFDQKRE